MTENITPLEDLVGDLFVNRQAELDTYWQWATSIPNQLLNSCALIGRRRTGKTAILVKLYNRLFYEQARVMPIFVNFALYLQQAEPMTYYDFARDYFTSYLRGYLAFHYREPLIVKRRWGLAELEEFAHSVQDEYVPQLLTSYERAQSGRFASPHDLVQWVIHLPKGEAAVRNMPTAIIIDEFQILTHVYDPEQKIYRDLTNYFQTAVETWWAPVLISGSAVSLLVKEALGGALSGRFRYHHLQPLAPEHGYDSVFRLAQTTQTEVDETLAEAIWQLTAGHPYAIYCLMTSSCPARQHYPALDALEEVMTFELRDVNGLLYQHYEQEFNKYSQELNDGPTTRRVMLWATKYPDQRINVEQVAAEIGVTVEAVRESLEKLRWADIVQKMGLSSYIGPTDPMLCRFIEYQHHIELENLAPEILLKDWHKEYQRLSGRLNNFVGEVAEVYIQAVMQAFAGQQVDGQTYFNTSGQIELPHFAKLERRGGIIKAGVPIEIDLIGEWTKDEGHENHGWLVQIKYTKEPVDKETVEHFFKQTEALCQAQNFATVTRWYFCKGGFRKTAAEALKQEGVLYSDLAQFNALAKLVGFFGLPE